MAGYVIDKASVDILGTIYWFDSVDVDPEDDTDLVTGMTDDNAPIGVKRGNMRFNFSGELTMTTDSASDDLEAAWEDKRNCPVTVYYENGPSHSYANGYIAKVGIAAKSGEDVRRTVEMKLYNRSRS